MNRYPDAHTLLEQDHEPLMEINRSLFSIMSIIGYSIIAAMIVRTLDYLSIAFEIPIIEYFSLKWLYIIPFVILLEVFRRQYDDLYVFKRDTLTQHQGRLSLNMTVPVLRYEDIRAVSVEQDIMGRIFDYGTVCVNTASTDDVELRLEGVRSPIELGSLVEGLQILALQKAKKIPDHNPYLKQYMAEINQQRQAAASR